MGNHITQLTSFYQVDGIQRYTPFKNNDVKIVTAGGALRLEGPCGVIVEYDGIHIMKVQAPRELGKVVHGICGNCNGIADDFTTKNGTDVSSYPNLYSAIGNSYEVHDDSDLFFPQ